MGEPSAKTGARINSDLHPGIIVSIACAFSNQRVITAGSSSEVVNGVSLQLLSACAQVAAQCIAVGKLSEGTEGWQRYLPTFWRGRVHIIKMVEIKRVPGFAQHGKGIAFLDSLRLRTKGEQSDKQQQVCAQSSATDFLFTHH